MHRHNIALSGTERLCFATQRDKNVKIKQRIHLPLPLQNVWACLELFVCQAHQQSVPATPVLLFSIPPWHITQTTSVLGHCHLTGLKRLSWCQHSSYKACHLFETAHDAFWARVPILNQKIISGTRFALITFQLEHEKWMNGMIPDKPDKVTFFSAHSWFRVKPIIEMMRTWCKNGLRLTKQSGSPLWGPFLCLVLQTNEWSPPCSDVCHGRWGNWDFYGKYDVVGTAHFSPQSCLAKAVTWIFICVSVCV